MRSKCRPMEIRSAFDMYFCALRFRSMPPYFSNFSTTKLLSAMSYPSLHIVDEFMVLIVHGHKTKSFLGLPKLRLRHVQIVDHVDQRLILCGAVDLHECRKLWVHLEVLLQQIRHVLLSNLLRRFLPHVPEDLLIAANAKC